MKKLLALVAILPLLFVAPARGSEPVDDCVIRSFLSNLVLRTDSKLDVTENLTVDCGSLPDKHGIFRILPTQALRPDGYYDQTRISNVSITDENNSAYQFETITDSVNRTLSWKIGDANQIITGVHTYKLSYTVNNVTYEQNDQTIFNWNLNGNFWQLPIDNFQATISFPGASTTDSIKVKLYDGQEGDTRNTYSKFNWSEKNSGSSILNVISLKTLLPGVGITLNSALPTGVISSYKPNFFDLYGMYLWFILPFASLMFMYRLWLKRGMDPKLNLPEMVQYSPPNSLKPLELGLLDTNGVFKNQYLTATVIDLAVRGYLKIEELPKAFLGAKDYQLTLLKSDDKLANYEKIILETLFSSLTSNNTTTISAQKNNFYLVLNSISKDGNDKLNELEFLDQGSLNWRVASVILGLVTLGGGIFITVQTFSTSGWAVILTGIVIFLFGLIMDRRTPEGAKAFWELKGFKLYMDKVESYRDKFYEQENIFEKYLPYAVAFGMTGKWIKACQHLYSEKSMLMVMPLWYIGGAGFNVAGMDSAISSLSSQIGSSLSSSPSSSGGGGFSGGGGGGGGGGSW